MEDWPPKGRNQSRLACDIPIKIYETQTSGGTAHKQQQHHQTLIWFLI